MNDPNIDVFILSSREIAQLRRAVASALLQRVRATVTVNIICYEEKQLSICKDLKAALSDYSEEVLVHFVKEPQHSSRNDLIYRLRREALKYSRSELVAWLDDDDWWDFSHLQSLVASLNKSESRLVYSWRKLWTTSGLPFMEGYDPWHSDKDLVLARNLVELEIWDQTSHTMKDKMYPSKQGGYCGTISNGEWLMPTSLYDELTKDLNPTPDFGEDDLMLARIFDQYEITCTNEFTLNHTIRVI